MLRDDTAAAVTHDVFSRPRVETEPATVQPVHSEFLLWPQSLVWLEEDLFVERGNLLIECFASDAVVSCHTATANMEYVVQAISRLSCQDPSSHRSVAL